MKSRKKIERVLTKLTLPFKKRGVRFTVKVKGDLQSSSDLKFHVEVCKVEKENGMGIYFKRLRGSLFYYKEIVKMVESEIDL